MLLITDLGNHPPISFVWAHDIRCARVRNTPSFFPSSFDHGKRPVRTVHLRLAFGWLAESSTVGAGLWDLRVHGEVKVVKGQQQHAGASALQRACGARLRNAVDIVQVGFEDSRWRV